MRRLLALVALVFSLPAQAVTIDWVPVGNPDNAADTASNCHAANCGSVDHAYSIAKYETTNAQYAEFLNAMDPGGSNTLALYNAEMGSDASHGGIDFVSGNASGSKYLAKTDFENKPVTYVSLHDALRFANWLHNGQGSGDTETGAYTITVEAIANNTIVRNSGAEIFLPSENEWYKAAYYSPSGVYFDYPAGTDTPTVCAAPASTPNTANCAQSALGLTDVGAFTGSASPYGTFDQGGNLFEWNEEIDSGLFWRLRGGSWISVVGYLAIVPDQRHPNARDLLRRFSCREFRPRARPGMARDDGSSQPSGVAQAHREGPLICGAWTPSEALRRGAGDPRWKRPPHGLDALRV